MPGVFEHYFAHLLDRYPSVFFYFIAAFVVLAVTIRVLKGATKDKVMSFIGYCLVVLYVTVFSRTTNDSIKYGIIPFSSYIDIANGDKFLLPQVLMNIVMFLPVGILSKIIFRSWGWKKILACGTLFSILIELMQLMLVKGVAEVDDVIHNALGCMLGIALLEFARNMFSTRRSAFANV